VKDNEIIVFVLVVLAALGIMMLPAFWQVGLELNDLEDRIEALETVTATEVAK